MLSDIGRGKRGGWGCEEPFMMHHKLCVGSSITIYTSMKPMETVIGVTQVSEAGRSGDGFFNC